MIGQKNNRSGESREVYDNGLYWPDPRVEYTAEQTMIMPAHPDDPDLREMQRHYYEAVNRMDQAFGEVMKAMEREKPPKI